MKKVWLIGICFVAVAVLAESPKDQLLDAYANMQYSWARTLARKQSDSPEAQLVLALCAVFDRKKQDLNYGLPELKRIYQDANIDKKLRLQAGLAYARAAQTLQMRKGVYPEAENIDFNSIYDGILNQYPDCPEACFVIVYQAQNLLNYSSETKPKEVLSKLEQFIGKYKGDKEFLTPVYILLANQNIIQYSNYHKAVAYLVEALEAGIANPRTREETLFRIARTYDLKLQNKTLAEKYYKQFVKDYPNSSSTPIVKRYIRELSTSPKSKIIHSSFFILHSNWGWHNG